MKIKDIHQLSDEELRIEMERLRRRLFDLRSQSVTQKLEDPSMLSKGRRDVARIMTVIRQRQAAAAAAKSE